MENINYETLLKAMYFNYKRELGILYLNNNNICSNSFIYAVENDMYPFFHETKESEIYQRFFDIDKDLVKKVVRYIDEKDLNNQDISFYELEDKFGRQNRYKIYHILRYCYLDERFDENIWNKIKNNAPSEVKSFDKVFNINEDLDFISMN